MRRDKRFSLWFSAVGCSLALAGCYGDNVTPEVDADDDDRAADEAADADDVDRPPVFANGPDDAYPAIERPQIILHGNTRAEAFRTDEDQKRLVWLEYDQAILLKVARPQGGLSWVAGKLVERPMAFAMTRDYVFWTAPSNGRIFRLSLDGGPAVMIHEGGAPLAMVAGVEKELYFGDEDGCIRRISWGGGTADEISCGAEEAVIWLALSDGVLHWATDGGNLYRAPATGGGAELRATDEYFDSELLVDAKRVYWSNPSQRAIRSIRHDETEVRNVAIAQYQPSNLTQDRWYLYYATDADNSVKRVIKDGNAGPVVLADNVDHAGDVSLLGDYLYWMDQDGGDVFTMRLP
ncbi:MAG TPA: hypothetical protein VMZ28_19440 [Kofleriaceae bacterium]|nr:hypothetical protein [Kofleriaceae bacterium]